MKSKGRRREAAGGAIGRAEKVEALPLPEGGRRRSEEGGEGRGGVSACLPAAVSCVQCVFKHGTSVRPRKACNAAQPSLSPTPERHTHTGKGEMAVAVAAAVRGQGVAGALSDSDANDTKEDACAPAARKSTKAGELERGNKHACYLTCHGKPGWYKRKQWGSFFFSSSFFPPICSRG